MDLKPKEQFHDALSNLLREVCLNLGNIGLPIRQWYRIIRKDGSTEFPAEERIDFFALNIGLHKMLEKSPSLDDLVGAITQETSLSSRLLVDAAGNSIQGDKTAKRTWIWNTLLVRFLRTYFETVLRPTFDQNTFEELFERVIKDIEAKTIQYTQISPLINIELSVPEILIAPNLRIRSITTGELEKWLNQDYILSEPPLRIDDLLGLNCAAEVTLHGSPYEPLAREPGIPEGYMLINALRLLTDRNVGIAFTETTSNSLVGLGGTNRSQTVFKLFPEQSAIFSEDDGKQLIEILRHIAIGINSSKVGLALTRWTGAFDRHNFEDRLIDYWIALESLFTPDSNLELKYRASLRIASFLGGTPSERQKIYKDMRQSYDRRSNIVHGAKSTPDLKEVTDKTRSYLRIAILRILESDQPFEAENIEVELLGR